MKSYVADRSVLVPMTLSDLEKRDASGDIFRRIVLVSFDVERPNSAWKHAEERRVSTGSHSPNHRGWDRA